MDAAGVAGGEPGRGAGLCAGRRSGRSRPAALAGDRRSVGCQGAGAVRRGRSRGAWARQGRGAGAHAAESPVLCRTRDPAAAGRPRVGRGWYRRGAYGTRPRPGGLSGLQAIRAAGALRRCADQSGGRARRVSAVDPAAARHRAGRAAYLEGERRHHRSAARDRRAAGGQQDGAQLPALLAPQDADCVPCHAAVVHLDGAGQPACRCAQGHRKRALVSVLGPGAYRRHGRRAPGLDHLAAAHLGRADRLVRASRNRRAASAQHRVAAPGRRPRGAGRRGCLVHAGRVRAAE